MQKHTDPSTTDNTENITNTNIILPFYMYADTATQQQTTCKATYQAPIGDCALNLSLTFMNISSTSCRGSPTSAVTN